MYTPQKFGTIQYSKQPLLNVATLSCMLSSKTHFYLLGNDFPHQKTLDEDRLTQTTLLVHSSSGAHLILSWNKNNNTSLNMRMN